MRIGTQFTGSLDAGQSGSWFTHSWPQEWHVLWHVMPLTPAQGAPGVEWDVEVERADAAKVTYWFTIRNLSNAPMNFEARYAVMN
ncbi:hypothetical protein [Micromonospora sp. CPCC 206061]|uniref:hypothetical protein n=1 Tax=Micromonospora sp. CPCC 206061 TaxID=3122410 RepID=UPI002FF20FB0